MTGRSPDPLTAVAATPDLGTVDGCLRAPTSAARRSCAHAFAARTSGERSSAAPWPPSAPARRSAPLAAVAPRLREERRRGGLLLLGGGGALGHGPHRGLILRPQRRRRRVHVTTRHLMSSTYTAGTETTMRMKWAQAEVEVRGGWFHLGFLASELGVVERRLPVRRHAVDDVTVGALHAQRAKTQDYSRKTTTPPAPRQRGR